MLLARSKIITQSIGQAFKLLTQDQLAIQSTPSMSYCNGHIRTAYFPLTFTRNLSYISPFHQVPNSKKIATKPILLNPGEPIICDAHMTPFDLWLPNKSRLQKEKFLMIQKLFFGGFLPQINTLPPKDIVEYIKLHYTHDPLLPDLALGLTHQRDLNQFLMNLMSSEGAPPPLCSLTNFSSKKSAVSDFDFMKKNRYLIPYPGSTASANQVSRAYTRSRGGVLSAMLKTVFDGRKIHFNLEGINLEDLNFFQDRSPNPGLFPYNIKDNFDRDFIKAGIPFTFFELLNILGNVCLYYNTEFYENSDAPSLSLEQKIDRGLALQHGFKYPGQHLMMSYTCSQKQISEIISHYSTEYNQWLKTGEKSETMPFAPDFNCDI
ncbi:hypothetical protein [Pelagibaculum spongiae]|uniref:Uncharacterized protein n=1 Tax=Pelagibaculum spongiae TaxID=2080658 RepID=A0A2V1H4P1_9GAMM|nr:hypothetical protein [Pelagibaculum spongiae]PVZ70606.1 hypothetical protein DC094_08485 [Pelagibaculum spongiae]